MEVIYDFIKKIKFKLVILKKNINEHTKNNSSFKMNRSDYETLIIIQKINELNKSKKNIEKKINKVDENIKIIKDEKILIYH